MTSQYNAQYTALAKIHSLDHEASIVTLDQRQAEDLLDQLGHKTDINAELLKHSRNDMAFHEAELRRLYKKLDELDERKNDRNSRLTSAKNDTDLRSAKRDLDNTDKEIRDIQRRADEVESRIESSKNAFRKAKVTLSEAKLAAAQELIKAEQAQASSAGRLDEIDAVRETYLNQLSELVVAHYDRVSETTRNPDGAICYIEGHVCGNCRIGLSPQILNNVSRAKSIEFCPSCLHVLLSHDEA